MPTIAVLNMKGGSGKSTLAVHLARGLQEAGTVEIADTDPQGSVLTWASAANGANSMPTVHGVNPPLSDALSAFQADYVVLDGVAKAKDRTRQAVQVADLVLVPIRPSGLDLWGSDWLIETIRQRQRAYGSPTAAFVIAQQVVGTNLAAEIAGVLEEYELPVLDGRMSHRVAYAEAMSVGSTVLDEAPSSKAADEVRQITRQTLDLLDE